MTTTGYCAPFGFTRPRRKKTQRTRASRWSFASASGLWPSARPRAAYTSDSESVAARERLGRGCSNRETTAWGFYIFLQTEKSSNPVFSALKPNETFLGVFQRKYHCGKSTAWAPSTFRPSHSPSTRHQKRLKGRGYPWSRWPWLVVQGAVPPKWGGGGAGAIVGPNFLVTSKRNPV